MKSLSQAIGISVESLMKWPAKKIEKLLLINEGLKDLTNGHTDDRS